MDYLNFTLVFCAVMVLFEWVWFPVGFIFGFIFNSMAKQFHSAKFVHFNMIANSILYCFFITSVTILTINKFRIINSGIVFLIFMLIISTIYFLFFFADKRNNLEKSQKGNFLLFTPEYEKISNIQIVVETTAILLFVLFVFFPGLIDNYFTSKIYEGLYFVATIKVLGTILGLFGLFSLTKYFRVLLFRMLIPMTSKKQ